MATTGSSVQKQSRPAPRRPIRRPMLLLTLGGVGKSLSAAALDAAFHESGRHAFAIRLETGARRDECIWDEFIDTDQFADGGIDQAFKPAWKLFEEALNENAIAILDVGANAQAAVLRHASESKLSNIVAARGIEVFACVVISRDADLIIEAAALIAEVGELMPEAKIVIILNEISGAFISDSTKEGRACRGILTPLLERHPHIKICLLYTSPSPRDGLLSRMPSSA